MLKRKVELLSSSLPGEATDGQIRGFLIKWGAKDTEVELNAHAVASTALLTLEMTSSLPYEAWLNMDSSEVRHVPAPQEENHLQHISG